MEFLGKRIRWKSQPYVLRFFETTWAAMVAYPAGQIAESGLKEAVSSDTFYFIYYAVMVFGFFLSAGNDAREGENPWRYRGQAAGVMIAVTVIAVAFPYSWVFASITIAALAYYFWPRIAVESS
ncbi:hypothetical protein ABRP95_04995 [Corynebacterium sp. KPL2895]|uniref:hypothetical protein n=1 Tax=Corynebacterium sp. KPL2895 TaxID=3158320 RepID=UPI0032EAA9B0